MAASGANLPGTHLCLSFPLQRGPALALCPVQWQGCWGPSTGLDAQPRALGWWHWVGSGGVSANPLRHPPSAKGKATPCSSGCQVPFCVCAGSEWLHSPTVPLVTAPWGHPSRTGVRDTHPPRTAQTSPLPAWGPQDTLPRAASSLLKGRGPEMRKKGREHRESHNLGRSGTPQPGHHPPISILEPQEQARTQSTLQAGRMGLSHRPHCRRAAASRLLQSCSPALQRDSAQPQPAPGPAAAAPCPSPGGGAHTPHLATALPWSPSPPEPPPRPIFPPAPGAPSPVHPYPRTTGCTSSPSAGRDPPPRPSRGSKRWGMADVSLPVPKRLCLGDGQRAGSGPTGLPAQSPSSGFRELSTDSCYGTSPGAGRKDLGFFPGGWD